MTPEEFRRYGHRLIDFLADYHAGIAKRPVMSPVRPGEIKAQLPEAPPELPEPMDAVLADLDRIVMPGLSHWQHPSLLRLFPGQRVARRHPRRSGEHRPRRPRSLLAVEPGGHGGRGGRHRLGAPHGRPLRCVERRNLPIPPRPARWSR